MKKLVFIIIMFLGLFFVAPHATFAQTDAEYSKALKYYNTKQYAKAVEQLQDYVKKNPDPAAYYLMGYSLYKLGRFNEATQYFNEAYLLDPDFSLEKAGLIQKQPEDKTKEIAQPADEQVPSEQKQPAAKPKTVQPEVKKEPVPAVQPTKGVQPQKPETKTVTPQKATPQKVEPPESVQPPAGIPPAPMPSFPKAKGAMPPGMPAPFMKMMEWLIPVMVIITIILIIISIYVAVCHFLIAKKLNVTASWTAFLTLTVLLVASLNLIAGPEFFVSNKLLTLFLSIVVVITSYIGYHWPIIGSARKPWWWIFLPIPLFIITGILMVIPFMGIFSLLLFAAFFGYLYMCITENLGKNKWLGLLIVVPFANLVWLGILAFSKSEKEEQTKTTVIEPPAEGTPPEEQF